MGKRSVAPVICLLLLVGLNSFCVLVCTYSLQWPYQCGVVFLSPEMCVAVEARCAFGAWAEQGFLWPCWLQ